jgi:glycerol-3-phosphate dehydrogenase
VGTAQILAGTGAGRGPLGWGAVPASFNRGDALERLGADEFDVLVIGGGITGCGTALDAAARGLRTALVEAQDFASGTSSKSSKMVHGGLRYLQQHDYRLVYEALHERQRLLVNAPHLVHPLPFLVPLFGKDGVVAKGVAQAYSVALWTYDLTGGIRIGKRHRRLSAGEALGHIPVLSTDRLVASFLYWDAQADDARLTLAVARTAADHGAVLANYSPVVELVEERGRVAGAVLGDGTRIEAAVVVNAGGVWSEKVATLDGHAAGSPIAIRPAKGIHLTVPASKLPCDFAAVLSVPGDKRSVFVVPWAVDEAEGPDGPNRYTYIGTTDTDYYGPLEDPDCTADDVEYVLRAVNHWTSANLTPSDVTGSWAGLRPLISDARSERTADLSRRHSVMTSPNGLVTVTGGKLTTYRLMAADTVEAALNVLPDPAAHRRGSPTARLRLFGAPSSGPGQGGSPEGEGPDAGRLYGRYGTEAGEIARICSERPDLAEPIAPSLPYLKAEAVYAARREMAFSLDDVMSRRTRARILDREAAASAAASVASLLAGELGWDSEETARQLASFAAAIESDRRVFGELASR